MSLWCNDCEYDLVGPDGWHVCFVAGKPTPQNYETWPVVRVKDNKRMGALCVPLSVAQTAEEARIYIYTSTLKGVSNAN